MTKGTPFNRNLQDFTPMSFSLKEIRAAIPEHLFVKDTRRSLLYLLRDAAFAITLWKLALFIDPLVIHAPIPNFCLITIRGAFWITYWWFQGLVFTALWIIGHECGHGAFSDHQTLNDIVGYVCHTASFTPYFSWKISHHRHHTFHNFVEKDEVYVPKTRSDLGLPPHSETLDYEDFFGDTPIYTLYMLIRQQLFAFRAYLLFNVSGQKNYPRGTNHFDPNSVLFTRSQRIFVILSNFGIAFMTCLVAYAIRSYGFGAVMKFYGVPWVCVNHWFIMITYLHHTDPIIPRYRGNQWNFQRGAASTVDRNFLGWQGRFFLHDVAHYHVIHHFFPKMPWYHGEEATRYLRTFIGDQYHHSSEPVFSALWKTYNDCQFIEDKGDIIFYRNKKGGSARRAMAEAQPEGEK